MPELTRRHYPERQDCWHVYYGDVQVGTIAIRTGVLHHEDPWGWICGFYPGLTARPPPLTRRAPASPRRGAYFLSKRIEADFPAWRDQRDWTERKYAMWERGERMPSQMPSPLVTCFCGETFDSHRLEHTVIHVPHITAAQAVDGIRR